MAAKKITKEWLLNNLERDGSREGREARVARNIEKLGGAAATLAALGPISWPENYGDSPFEHTWEAARVLTKGTATTVAISYYGDCSSLRLV